MLQPIIAWYFDVINQYGLAAVILLMAMESSIFPVPSELVVPPAAYLRGYEQENAWRRILEVIAAGAIGSYLGSSATYWLARIAGRPFILRYGNYLRLSKEKLQHTEIWLLRHGAMGVFISRLLPGVRHINAIPAGLGRMSFLTFSLMTLLGSAVWCSVLAGLGLAMGPDMQILIASQGQAESPAYREAMINLTYLSVLVVLALSALYLLGRRLQTWSIKLLE